MSDIKIYQLVGCIDEGLSYSWHFRAKSEWHVAEYIIKNYQDYPDIFHLLGLDEYNRYEDEEPITPEVLLNAIGESYIDGDSAYGFEFFEMTEDEIVNTNNADLVASTDIKVYLHQMTGHKNYPYKTFVPFHDIGYGTMEKLVPMESHRFEQAEQYDGFAQWLEKVPEIEANELLVLEKLAEKSSRYQYGASIFDKLANFVVPLVNLAEVEHDRYNVFYDRLLEGMVGDTFLKGRVAMLIGEGYGEPAKIDFILHVSSFVGTPHSADYAMIIAQMLTAMHKDNLSHIKGAYIQNSSWHFFIIEKDENSKFQVHEYPSVAQGRLEGVKEIFRFIKAFKQREVEK